MYVVFFSYKADKIAATKSLEYSCNMLAIGSYNAPYTLIKSEL